MDFVNEFKKTLTKMEGVSIDDSPPSYWFGSGNYCLNYITSGDFNKFLPQGRVTALAGASGTGKTFLLANIIRNAQQDGAFIVYLDSENAFDSEFAAKIGVNTNENYIYASVTTISQVKKIISQFIGDYKSEYEGASTPPKVVLAVDSLDMLMTDTELEHYKKGETKGDQGQHPKQLKALLRNVVNDIKNTNISVVVTKQVYKNQEMYGGTEGSMWVVNDAIRYSASQIILLSKLRLKDKVNKEVQGIRMKCEGFKTRFTKPFQSVIIDVPYSTGMDPYSGLLETALGLGVVQKRGPRYSVTGNETTWYSKDINLVANEIIESCNAQADKFVQADMEDEEFDMSDIKSVKDQKREMLLEEAE